MITAIEIENFKGIGEPGIRIDLKPITLLFGPNSSGKSTIIEALMFLYDVIGGPSKGRENKHGLSHDYVRAVHNCNTENTIRIRIEFELDEPAFDLIGDFADNGLLDLTGVISLDIYIVAGQSDENNFIQPLISSCCGKANFTCLDLTKIIRNL